MVYLAGLVSVVLLYTGGYMLVMDRVEGSPRSFFAALEFVMQTLTTTGYGQDSAVWSQPATFLFVSLVQVSGIAIGFITLRVLVIPLFERTPMNLDDRLSLKDDHVVVAEYARDTEVLLDELEDLAVGYVLLESDQEEAKRLSDEGYQAIHGDPEEPADLRRASIEQAALLITDAGDRTASVVLTALELNEALRVVSFTESTRRKAALAEIGVDRSVAPHALIGQRLAEKATTPVAVEGTDDEAVEVREVLVRRSSPLHGQRVRESPFFDGSRVTLVAGWFEGELRLPPPPDQRITPNTVLLVAGPAGEIDTLAGEAAGVRAPRRDFSKVVVAGLGEGGQAAVDTLADVSVTTVDEDETREPDVVGDVTEPEVLSAAGIESASALVVTVDDDAATLLTVAMARSLSPDVEILVRVSDAEKTAPAFRAGADYVLSTQRVAARLVAAEAHGERVFDPVSQIRLVRAPAESLAGRTLATARRETDRDWTPVAVIRDGEVNTEGTVTVEPEDELLVAGSDRAIRAFERALGSASS